VAPARGDVRVPGGVRPPGAQAVLGGALPPEALRSGGPLHRCRESQLAPRRGAPDEHLSPSPSTPRAPGGCGRLLRPDRVPAESVDGLDERDGHRANRSRRPRRAFADHRSAPAGRVAHLLPGGEPRRARNRGGIPAGDRQARQERPGRAGPSRVHLGRGAKPPARRGRPPSARARRHHRQAADLLAAARRAGHRGGRPRRRPGVGTSSAPRARTTARPAGARGLLRDRRRDEPGALPRADGTSRRHRHDDRNRHADPGSGPRGRAGGGSVSRRPWPTRRCSTGTRPGSSSPTDLRSSISSPGPSPSSTGMRSTSGTCSR